jgi:hypothetical protein
MAKPGPRLGKLAREEHLAKVAALDRKGWSPTTIARHLGVTAPAIHYDLKVIAKRYLKGEPEDNRIATERMLDGLRDIRREAWREWKKSRRDAKSVTTTERVEEECDLFAFMAGEEGEAGAKIPRRKQVVTKVEGRLAGSAYMNIILDTYKAERELRGLDAPKKVMGLHATIDWDKVTELMEEEDDIRVIEHQILSAGTIPPGLVELKDSPVELDPETGAEVDNPQLPDIEDDPPPRPKQNGRNGNGRRKQ